MQIQSHRKRGLLSLSLILSLGVFIQFQVSIHATVPSGATLAFEDNFDGPNLDTSEWRYRLGGRLDGYNRAENVSIVNGKLRIDLKEESFQGYNYTCGGIISKQAFGYGYYETKVKMTNKKGWHTSFWVMGAGQGVEQVLEIDGFEVDSVFPDEVKTNAHHYKPFRTVYGSETYEGVNTATAFHTYAFEWTPWAVYFYVNDVLIRTLEVPGPHIEQNLWLTSLALDYWSRGIEGDTFVEFEYIRYYEKDYGTTIPATATLVDNGDSGYAETGSWTSSSAVYGADDTNTRYSNTIGNTATWTPNLPTSGDYLVYAWNPSISNNTTNVEYTVNYNGGNQNVSVNQLTAGQYWVPLGIFNFDSGTSGNVKLTVVSSTGFTRADAAMFVPLEPLQIQSSDIDITNGTCEIDIGSTIGRSYQMFRSETMKNDWVACSNVTTATTELTKVVANNLPTGMERMFFVVREVVQ